MPASESSRPTTSDPTPGHGRYGHEPVRVAAVRRSGAAPSDLLDEALEASDFWRMLDDAASKGRPKSGLLIAVKPDLDAYEAGEGAGTDPSLVEGLVARLRHAGYPQVAVCDGRNRPDGWLQNRGALGVPDLMGYAFEAPEGEPYDVAWVDDDPRSVPLNRFDDGGALHVHGAWVDADVRICFGACRTDDAWGYALCVQNLLGLVSSSGAASGWSPEDRCLHLLRRVPPDFAILDAVVSRQGSLGSGWNLRTETVVASSSALLVDWVAAMAMGVDPHVSPMNARALDALGLPRAWTLEGDAHPWDGWTNPSPSLLEHTRARAAWPELDELVRAALQPTDRELFPFRDVLLDQLNARVLSTLEKVAEPRVRAAVLGLLAWGLAWTARARHAFLVNAGKERVLRSVAPLTLDFEALPAESFDRTVGMVEGFARVLDGAPVDARGLRIRTVGGHIHFAGSRILPLDFDAFVSRVPVSAAIRYMNDYLGGSWTVVDADAWGRPLRQAERNVYLPQPNWVGIFGGEEIDVEKVERAAYEPERHAIWWRTVRSPNDSADSDDGSVEFLRTTAGQVEVRIFARQRFRLPPTVASARVERWPGVHGELVSEAYGHFFDGTLSNLRAAYDGTPYRIGRDPAEAAREPVDDVRTLMSGALALASRIFGWTPPAGPGHPDEPGAGGAGPDGYSAPTVDELGFAHFPGRDAPVLVAAGEEWSRAAGDGSLTPMTFLAELGRAVGRDMAAAASDVTFWADPGREAASGSGTTDPARPDGEAAP